MYIIGTSGHIDHGKTSLIAKLTGTNCDRLPEEKKREMTIDLGFACLDLASFDKVSIIDVPGHERFIKNMVAGAWGIDLGLLIIAADDGWMPQTEDHFRVLELLGIEKIIIVINKIDLSDPEILEILKEEIKEKIKNSPFAQADLVLVSAKTGQGLDQLKNIILKNLKQLSKKIDAGKPYLYVDRSFAVKGFGTVVTGSLKNGFLEENDLVYLFPARKEIRLKKIESHFSDQNSGRPSQRTALNLANIGANEIKRGDLIVKENFLTESKNIIASLKLLNPKTTLKNNRSLEFLAGTASFKGKIIFLEKKEDNSSFLVNIKLNQPYFFYPSEPFVFTKPGSHRILGGGKIIFPEDVQKKILENKKLKQDIDIIKEGSLEDIILFMVTSYQAVATQKLVSLFPFFPKQIEDIFIALAKKKLIIIEENIIFAKDFFDNKIKNLEKKITQGAGFKLKELVAQINLSEETISLCLKFLKRKNLIFEKEGLFLGLNSFNLESISKEKQNLLTKILNLKEKGFELKASRDKEEEQSLKDLIKLKFLISLDGNLLYHHKIYDQLKARILAEFDQKDKLTISEAKDAVNLSRKYILPLLNRIEREGLIKRLGDFRIKC